jgi:demethylmenaquinone methyltransferase/2-methoxy-6-polyprenyl-1,4-benzoquinol methylase
MAQPPDIFEPHPVLAPHYATKDEKARFLRGIFDRSAPHYEGIAAWGFFGRGHWYRVNAMRLRGGLQPGMNCIDIASGTGPTARAVAEVAGGAQFLTCVEPSFGMLRESRKLLNCAHVQGAAEAIPLVSETFDFLTMGFALRHVSNLAAAFGEYHRVLKPGGRLFIMDVIKPPNRVGMFLHKLYFRDFLPRFTKLMTGSKEATYLMEYYWETMDQMVPEATVVEALKVAGFEEAHCHRVLGCFVEYTAVRALKPVPEPASTQVEESDDRPRKSRRRRRR